MKIQIPFKSPDAVYYILKDLNLQDEKKEKIEKIINKYIKYGESVTIEIDTETEEATVVKI